MIFARVDGVIVSSVCHPSLAGRRTVICQPLDEKGEEEGEPIIAVDPFGAGLHQHIFVLADGAHAREHVKDPKSPLRNLVLGIVDRAPGRPRGLR